MNALFVCGRGRIRSPTAEHVFASWPGVETDSAGLDHDADVPLSPEQINWADVIFVMERRQRQKLSRQFRGYLRGQRIVCLDISDDFEPMEPALVELLERRVTPFLAGAAIRDR
jgi:predicted protein tyrosine phosphatase